MRESIRNFSTRRILRSILGQRGYEEIRYLIAILKFVLRGHSHGGMASALVHPGDVVFDIGANIGGLSYLFSNKCGSQGRVYSFEPHKQAYTFLNRTIKYLSLNNVQSFNIGISHENTISNLVIPAIGNLQINTRSSIHAETIRMYAKKIDGYGPGDISKLYSQPIPVVTLDSFCTDKGIGRVDFIKEDTEGHTSKIIQGMMDNIERHHPTLYLETSADSKHLEVLQELGYEIFVELHSGLIQKYESISKDEQYDKTNTILIHKMNRSKFSRIICNK